MADRPTERSRKVTHKQFTQAKTPRRHGRAGFCIFFTETRFVHQVTRFVPPYGVKWRVVRHETKNSNGVWQPI